MSAPFGSLRNKGIISALAGGGIGVIIYLMSPNPTVKTIGNWLCLASVGSVIATQFVVDSAEKINDELSKQTENKIVELTKDKASERKKVVVKTKELEDNISLVKLLKEESQLLKTDVDAMRVSLKIAQSKIDSLNSVNEKTAIELLNESFTEFQTQIEDLFSKLSRRYPQINSWNGIAKEYSEKVAEFSKQINVVATSDSVEDLIGDSLALQHEIIYRGSLIKIKAYKSVVTFLTSQLIEVIPLEEHKKIITNLKADYIKNINSIRQEYGQLVDTASEEFSEHLKQLCDRGVGDADTISSLQLEIYKLNQKLAELSKPHRFPGLTEQARVGNAIIDYYYRLGFVLDGVFWDTTETGYKLLFHVGRNGSRFISAEMVNDNDAPQKLKEVSGSLNTPEFIYNNRGGVMVLEIQTRYPHKQKSNQDEINRLWIPAAKFEQTVSCWSRVRITGGSESGKSPTAENLAVCILKNRPGLAKLFNPQHDSVKNYWTIPVVGTSHADSEKAIAHLAKRLDARASGDEPKDQFELYIFDEIDSTMSHTKGKKSVIGSNVNFIIKQSSHQNLGAIFIGQNANVSEYPGMDRSDWNNAVNVHIGANAYDAIQNSNRFTSDEITRLKATTDKLMEYCESKNQELGLEKTDPTAYRFALVVEPNKKPHFIELPAFGCYTYDQIDSVEALKTSEGITSGYISNTQNQEPLKRLNIKDSLTSTMDVQSGYVGLSCPGCGSTNLRKAGKYGSSQRHQCKDCGKKFIG